MSEQSIEVPVEVAANMKIIEFDRQIADAELHVASLKKQRADFVFEANNQLIRQRFEKRQTDQQRATSTEAVKESRRK